MKLSEMLAEASEKLQGSFDENRGDVEKMIANPTKYKKEDLAEVADIYFQAFHLVKELLSEYVEYADHLEKQIDQHKGQEL